MKLIKALWFGAGAASLALGALGVVLLAMAGIVRGAMWIASTYQLGVGWAVALIALGFFWLLFSAIAYAAMEKGDDNNCPMW